MEKPRTPFKGVTDDVKGRIPFYKHDWLNSCGTGVRYSYLMFELNMKWHINLY